MSSEIQLPDFDEMMEIIDKIYNLNLRRGELKITLNVKEAYVTQEAKTNSDFFDTKGNPHAQTTIDRLYLFAGLAGELIPYREELEAIEAELAYLRSKLDFYKLLVDVWRTQAANERTLSG